MRIVFLSMGLGGGGAEAMMCRLSNLFIDKGNDVTIFVLNKMNTSYSLDEKIEVVNAGGNSKNKIVKIFNSIKKISAYLSKNQIDIVLCFMITTVPFAVIAKLITRSKVKIIGAERANPKAVKKLHRKVVALFINYCEGFVFQTIGAQRCYPKRIQNKSVVIGNIIPLELPYIDKSRETSSICSAGRLHPDKDFDTVIRAFYRVHQNIPNVKLHIFGDGAERARLARLAKELQIEKNIIFEGFCSNLSQKMSKFDIFIFSSKAEGMPNVLMEAMAMGMACVATNCEFGPSELISDGENGYLVDVGDEVTMADKVETLLINKDLRYVMGDNAKKIRNQYHPEKIVSQYLEFFDNIRRAESD